MWSVFVNFTRIAKQVIEMKKMEREQSWGKRVWEEKEEKGDDILRGQVADEHGRALAKS